MKIVIATQNEHKKKEIYNIFDNLTQNTFSRKQKYFFKELKKDLKLFTLKDIGFNKEINENGINFFENSKIKVFETYKFLKEKGLEKEYLILGDDSGLIIEDITEFYHKYNSSKLFWQIIEESAFDQKNIEFWKQDLKKIYLLPGIYSKRFAFISDSEKRNQYVLKLMSLIEKKIGKNLLRKAYFNTFIYFKCSNSEIIKCNDVKLKNQKFYNQKFYKLNKNNIEFSVYGKVEGIIAPIPGGKNGFGYDPIFYIPELKRTLAQLTLREKNLVSHRAKALKNFINKLIELI